MSLAAIAYTYDVAGNLTKTAKLQLGGGGGDITKTIATYTYDRLGRRLAANDPDLGLVETAYNSLSELISQQSPRLRNQSSSLVQAFSYDLLGRVVQRTEPTDDFSGTLTTTWSYDSTTGGNAGIGQLTQETISGGTQPTFTRNYTYGGASGGRLSQLSTTIGTETFLTGHSYDALGRPDEITYPASPSYPTGLVVEHTYNPRGYLERLSDAHSGQVYYQVLDVNARGQIEQEYRGDHSTTTLNFIANTGRLLSTSATRPLGAGQETLQNFSYTYDSLGNMLSRSDLLQNLSETFTFDEQNRLSSATVKQGSSTLAITDFAFDDLGNLTHKSDITSLGSTSLAYAMTGNAGPHAVTSLNTGSGSVNFSYDANGNLTSGDAGNSGRAIAWSAYDKPVEITQGAITRTFAYGPDRQRYQQVHDEGSGPTTTTYVGDYYTRVDAGGGNVLHKLYLYANGRVIAIVEDDADTGAGSTNTRYLHRDHLGSITLIVDDTGLERLSYDAWGQRRDATDWVGAPATTPTEVRGYTGHEHLDDVNLIHMNGRIYDPQLGRMVSGDPVLPDPMNSQSYNRYSYVRNNPLKFTDPSGFADKPPEEVVVTGQRPYQGHGFFGYTSGASYVDPSTFMNDSDWVMSEAFLCSWWGGMQCSSNESSTKMHEEYVTKKEPVVTDAIKAGEVEQKQQVDNQSNATQSNTAGNATDTTGSNSSTVVPVEVVVTAARQGPGTAASIWSTLTSATSSAFRTLVYDYEEPLGGSYLLEAVTLLPVAKVAKFGKFFAKGAKPPNMSPLGAGRQGAFNEAKRQAGVPTSQQPSRTIPNTDRHGNLQPGRVYEYEVPAPGGGTRTVRIRDDAGGHDYGAGNSQNRGPHFNDEAKNHYDY